MALLQGRVLHGLPGHHTAEQPRRVGHMRLHPGHNTSSTHVYCLDPQKATCGLTTELFGTTLARGPPQQESGCRLEGVASQAAPSTIVVHGVTWLHKMVRPSRLPAELGLFHPPLLSFLSNVTRRPRFQKGQSLSYS